MSFHRTIFVALATLFTIGMTSLASADCCNNWGYSAPVSYGAYGGCGGCGTPTAAVVFAQPVAPAPIAISNPVTAFGGPCCGWSGCGDCGGYSAGCNNCGGWGGWGGGCGGCGAAGWSGGGCGGCGRSIVYAAPALYVVNQGPYYTGPGITVPYSTYSPGTAYAPAVNYPYVPGYGAGYGGPGYGVAPYPGYYSHPYYRARYAYRAPMYMHPRYYGPRPGYYRAAPGWRRYP
jgi:hypothetical protein